MKLFYICYENYVQVDKSKLNKNRVITSIGTYKGSFIELIDLYDYSDIAIFECLVPDEEIISYFDDMKKNNQYEYNKITNFLIDMACYDITDIDYNVYLNMLGLSESW